MDRTFKWVMILAFLAIGGLIYVNNFRETPSQPKEPPQQTQQEVTNGCISCHSDQTAMRKSGYPEFYFTNAIVREQSKMPGVKCEDCHLGDSTTTDKEKAHDGVLRNMVIGVTDELKMQPVDEVVALKPRKDKRVNKLLPHIEGVNVLGLEYGLKEEELLTYDPDLAKKTCGKCHTKEFEEYNATPMAAARFQSLYTDWTAVGPHNCRPWLVYSEPQRGLLKQQLDKGFSEVYQSENNQERLNDQLASNLDLKGLSATQRACNRCHADCNGCHYMPQEEKGVHVFSKTPTAISCYGGGRGTICHAGPEDRRRGAGYIRGDYAFPAGLPTDVHNSLGLNCIDCHQGSENNKHNPIRRVEREETCANCHQDKFKKLQNSTHKNLVCESCHIQKLGGYQATVIAAGKTAGLSFPLTKHKQYYGTTERPILIKDQEGQWIPVKPTPHVVNNVSKEFKSSNKVSFRNIKNYRPNSHDAYYTIGTVTAPNGSKSLLWFQMDKMSHAIGPGRSCQDCHATAQQKYKSQWTYTGQVPTEKVSGSHWVVADKQGLRIEDIQVEEDFTLGKGYELEDFAYWVYEDDFKANGDFALPKLNTTSFEGNPHQVK
ncbi:cytochrome c3 family protein [Selenihalanaerobacter shriftii]|uniref:Cytochrome c7 n=1 Tax=Selenihalanaerobacter shriftii TaxID=142842 RepID=A0A1T4PUS6_9FIRM|nr:cytochrome c3 family protein [Selenihalanaerobacter shriftii]SJZ94688.1 Cytochrome c7 [Selenihalanaerobacter shriftii]